MKSFSFAGFGRHGRRVFKAVLRRLFSLVLLFSTTPVSAADFTWTDAPALPLRPANVLSFVRTFDNQIAFTDRDFASLVAANVGEGKRWASIDVLMQQCYGGGFALSLSPLTTSPFTIATAANWNEVAWTAVNTPIAPAAQHNFTSAWTVAARAKGTAGMRELAFTARQEDVPGPVNAVFSPTAPEHPQYRSADAAPGGANDVRTLTQTAESRLFSMVGVFGAGDRIATRHLVNEVRMVSLLSARSAADQVVTLVKDGTAPTPGTGGTIVPDPVAIPGAPTTGSTSAANVVKALNGTLFSGATAQAGDKLAVYVTGHGGKAVYERFRDGSIFSNPEAPADGIQYVFARPAQREAGGLPPDSFNPDLLGDSDEATGLDEIQFHLGAVIAFDAVTANGPKLFLNGLDVTDQLLEVTGAFIRELPDLDPANPAPGAAMVVQIALPHGTWATGSETVVELRNIGSLAGDANLLRGVGVWSGDNEEVFINAVPEPAGLWWLPVVGWMAWRAVRRVRSENGFWCQESEKMVPGIRKRWWKV